MLRRKRIGIHLPAATLGILLALASPLVAPSAFAQLAITTITIADFAPVTLDGTTKTTTATMGTFSVTDSRLVVTGWNVTVAGTQFREWTGSGYAGAGKSLPTGSLSMPRPSVTSSVLLTTLPTITPGPYAPDGASIKIASAGTTTLRGTYNFASGGPLTLTIPAHAFARTYRSELTFSVNSGP